MSLDQSAIDCLTRLKTYAGFFEKDGRDTLAEDIRQALDMVELLMAQVHDLKEEKGLARKDLITFWIQPGSLLMQHENIQGLSFSIKNDGPYVMRVSMTAEHR